MALGTYRRLCQKKAEENYLLDKYIFRHISIYLTILFLKLKITPNQATFLSLLCSLAGCCFLAFNTRAGLLSAAVLILCYYLLDHVDGELARYYRATGALVPSLGGHYLDVLVHRYSSNVMVFCLGLALYRLYGNPWLVGCGFLAAIGLSSFPNVVAAQAVAGIIAADARSLQDPALREVMQLFDIKKAQLAAVHGPALSRRLLKLLWELLFFPGHIILLVIAVVADAFFPGFPVLQYRLPCRLLLLIFLAVIYTGKTVLQSIFWLQKLKRIGC